MILTVCPNTALDKVFFVKEWTPGVPMRTDKMVTSVGGKGLDSSVVLSQLGIPTVGIGFFSGKIGQELVDLLLEYGIEPEPIWVDGVNRIAHVIAEEKTNIHSHIIVGHVEINEAQKTAFVDKFRQRLDEADWVIFAGSLPACLNENFYAELIRIARQNNKPCLIDSQKGFMRQAVPASPNIVKMNWEEFEWTFDKKAPTLDALYQQARALKAEKAIQNLVLTLSTEGIMALTEQGDFLAKAPLQKPLNAAGAGDAVSSAIVWRLAKGDTWLEALRWGSAVSAASVLTLRTGDVNMPDVLRILPDVQIDRLDDAGGA